MIYIESGTKYLRIYDYDNLNDQTITPPVLINFMFYYYTATVPSCVNKVVVGGYVIAKLQTASQQDLNVILNVHTTHCPSEDLVADSTLKLIRSALSNQAWDRVMGMSPTVQAESLRFN